MADARPVFRLALVSRPISVVLQSEVAAALEFRPALDLVAPHFVDGIADQLHDIKLVEGDLGLGEVLAHASDLGAAHVDADLLYARCVGVVTVDPVRKLGDRVSAATGMRMTSVMASVSNSSVKPEPERTTAPRPSAHRIWST